ncbi:hypothetical protein BJY04DRAFT_107659 [Aspergillus karnatakaensis]|uniref:uncharacterized protein n=1 Tax=Aspergillus karnatakaensis TaxID=1810916 RepID=UPI003CCDC54F
MCEMLGPSVGLFEDVSGPNYTSSLSQTALDPLQDQVDKILRDLQQYISILENPSARSTQSKSTALEQASQVVNGHSIRLGINAYFRYVYPNCPFVHQPSFDPGSASSTLLLSMFAAGHAVLQDKTCTPSSELMDLIEDYVFNDPTLNIPVRGHIPTIIQAMQAATIAIQMRAATGDPRIQQRTRDCRFPRLMNALRSYQTLSLKNTTIRDFQTTPFDWQLFIQTECLIRITFAAYMLDAHFTIFFRAPARATIQEMAGDLPCADALFMADTSQSCQTMLESTESVVLQPPSLASLVRTFMDTSFDPQDRDLQGLTVRHLFLLILGFHAVIFSAQRTCIMVHVSHAVERALERWEMLWNTVSNNDNNQLASIGLMKFAPQFCVLAKMMLDPGIESGSLSRVNVWTKDYVHDFMRKAK